MSVQKVAYRAPASTSSRSLHSVQRTLRGMIWLGMFVLMGGLTLLAAFLASMVYEFLGIVVFIVGGIICLIVPGTISSCLYVIPEFERAVVLKMGKFVDVKGPGNFWVIPYPPFYQSVAAKLDLRVQTRVIT
ncbi:MAG: hypothetical protein U9R15_03225, partial [Chloroflexota bacterium]|nr:hypothetical protein [Chloroflexota bacterium]